MPRKYVLTPAAKTDIKDIWHYTLEQWGGAHADHYIDQIENRIEMLAENPGLGKKRDEIKQGYRSFPEGSHLIFYRPTKQRIEILGVLHQSMDVEQRLSTEE